MPLPIGTVLDGKFKIVQVLGEGGMGTVYKVAQEGPPGTPPYYYAVKELLISPNISEEERKAAIDRFNKEIELLRGLKHHHIAALLYPFQENGKSYFVMEFVPGRSLEKMLEDNKGPLPEEQVIKWAMQVCEALSYIHSRTPPIILRDLKPGNVMITPQGEVQLIDFGIARRFDPNKKTNTENLGTISYASPEHLGSITAPGYKRSAQSPKLQVQTDARSDIYSLGATIYHLLTNYEPDPIQTPAPGSILAKNPRLRTIQVGNKVVCPIEQVIIKAMQQSPAQRFQSAEAMRVALQNCLPTNSNVAATTIHIPAVSPSATVVVPLNAATGLVCPKCGYQNRPGAKFCKRDGQPLIQGATVVPPQARLAPRAPIQARPVQQPIVARSVPPPPPPPIRARPITVTPVDHMRLGQQAMANKNYAEAVEQFKQALAGGVSYEGLYNLGRAYRQYGLSLRETDTKLCTENLKLAAERLEEATRTKANAHDAYFQLGMCYRDLKLLSEAMVSFKRALELAPQDSAIYYQMGLVAAEQGLLREAETHFRAGLKINPYHTLLLIALGRLYIQMRKYKAAVNTLRQAAQADPTQWEAWVELGRAHMKLNEWNLALSAFEQALAQNPPFLAEISNAMAMCYLKLNKKREARQKVQEVLQRDPTNTEAIRLQRQL